MRGTSFIVKRFTIGLAACVVAAAAVPAAAQTERRAAPVYGEMPEQRDQRGEQATTLNARKGRIVRESKGPSDVAVKEAPPSAATGPASPSTSGGGGNGGDGNSGSVGAPPATPAAPPSGLSHDAPDTAPSIGVSGGDKSGGPSPASTPEPSTLLLMGAGLAGLYQMRRRR